MKSCVRQSPGRGARHIDPRTLSHADRRNACTGPVADGIGQRELTVQHLPANRHSSNNKWSGEAISSVSNGGRAPRRQQR